MGSVFDDYLAAASIAADETFGDSEGWCFLPFTIADGNVNGRMAPDPDRASVNISGIFYDPYARASSGAARRQGVKAERPGHASARPQIDFDKSQLPYDARQGDRVRRLKTGKLYHLAEVKKETAGPRLQVDLNELKEL